MRSALWRMESLFADRYQHVFELWAGPQSGVVMKRITACGLRVKHRLLEVTTLVSFQRCCPYGSELVQMLHERRLAAIGQLVTHRPRTSDKVVATRVTSALVIPGNSGKMMCWSCDASESGRW